MTAKDPQAALLEMDRWPGTPGYRRMMRAGELLADHQEALTDPDLLPPGTGRKGQASRDARQIILGMRTARFQTWAQEELQELYNPDQEGLTALLGIARQGTGEDMTGMVLTFEEGEHGSPGYQVILAFTRVHNNPEWTGMNRHWPLCRGLQVHILGRPGVEAQPSAVAAIPPGWQLGSDGETEETPGGTTARAIREIALWHGAVRCTWHPDAAL